MNPVSAALSGVQAPARARLSPTAAFYLQASMGRFIMATHESQLGPARLTIAYCPTP